MFVRVQIGGLVSVLNRLSPYINYRAKLPDNLVEIRKIFDSGDYRSIPADIAVPLDDGLLNVLHRAELIHEKGVHLVLLRVLVVDNGKSVVVGFPSLPIAF